VDTQLKLTILSVDTDHTGLVKVKNPPECLLSSISVLCRKHSYVDKELKIETDDFLCYRSDRSLAFFSAGLLDRVTRALREECIPFEVIDEREPDPAVAEDEPDFPWGATSNEKRLIRRMVRHRAGLLELATEEQEVRTVALLAGLFPQARIGVIARNNKLAYRFREALNQQLEKPAGPTGAEGYYRVLVGCADSIAYSAESSFLIYLHADSYATPNLVQRTMQSRWSHRCFGFLRAGRRRDPAVQILLEQLTGPLIHRVRRPRAKVVVTMLPGADSSVRRGSDTLAAKRSTIWSNDERNALIAKAARKVLKRLRVPQAATDSHDADDHRQPRVAVLVESYEHACKLSKLLPNWEICSLHSEHSRDPSSVPSAKVIMTETSAAKKQLSVDCVIRATGRSSPLRVRGFPPRRSKTRRQVELIDFDDTESSAAVDHTQRRCEQYEASGFIEKRVVT